MAEPFTIFAPNLHPPASGSRASMHTDLLFTDTALVDGVFGKVDAFLLVNPQAGQTCLLTESIYDAQWATMMGRLREAILRTVGRTTRATDRVRLIADVGGPKGYDPAMGPDLGYGPDSGLTGRSTPQQQGEYSADWQWTHQLKGLIDVGLDIWGIELQSSYARLVMNGTNAAPHQFYRGIGTGNAAITYTAVPIGMAGQDIRIRYVVAGNSTPLSVSVAAHDITVNVATNGSGVATSTANQVLAAVAASVPAQAVVTVALQTGSDGTGVVSATVGGYQDFYYGDGGVNYTPTEVGQAFAYYMARMKTHLPNVVFLSNDSGPLLWPWMEDGHKVVTLDEPFATPATDSWPGWTTGGTAADWDVVGGRGTYHTVGSARASRVLPADYADARILLHDVRLSALPSSGNALVSVEIRRQSTNNTYGVQFYVTSTGEVRCLIIKTVGGVQTSLATSVLVWPGYTPGSGIEVEAGAFAKSIEIRVWPTNTPRPVAPTLIATDGSFANGTEIGILFNAAAGAPTWSIEGITMTGPVAGYGSTTTITTHPPSAPRSYEDMVAAMATQGQALWGALNDWSCEFQLKQVQSVNRDAEDDWTIRTTLPHAWYAAKGVRLFQVLNSVWQSWDYVKPGGPYDYLNPGGAIPESGLDGMYHSQIDGYWPHAKAYASSVGSTVFEEGLVLYSFWDHPEVLIDNDPAHVPGVLRKDSFADVFIGLLPVAPVAPGLPSYSPPDRLTLRGGLARDLRDPELLTFTEQELNDLLNQAIVEVGRIYPKGEVRELPVDEDAQEMYPTDVRAVFRVEVIRDGRVQRGVLPNGHDTTAQGGWDLHGGSLWLPGFVTAGLKGDDSSSIRVWGYWGRRLMTADTDIADVDAEAEFGVRTYAALLGYQRLQNDRMLFQQWLTNTGNSDVSPNQLAQTADMYQSQWREMRQRLRSLQRV